jgi:hypothetical protein
MNNESFTATQNESDEGKKKKGKKSLFNTNFSHSSLVQCPLISSLFPLHLLQVAKVCVCPTSTMLKLSFIAYEVDLSFIPFSLSCTAFPSRIALM